MYKLLQINNRFNILSIVGFIVLIISFIPTGLMIPIATLCFLLDYIFDMYYIVTSKTILTKMQKVLLAITILVSAILITHMTILIIELIKQIF